MEPSRWADGSGVPVERRRRPQAFGLISEYTFRQSAHPRTRARRRPRRRISQDFEYEDDDEDDASTLFMAAHDCGSILFLYKIYRVT